MHQERDGAHFTGRVTAERILYREVSSSTMSSARISEAPISSQNETQRVG
jgi:hypothetical protein